jgi:hypothetical protein
MSPTNEASGMEPQSFDVAGLVPANCGTLTGMRDEIILVSWLIVLMRTQESSSVCCEWQYQGSESVLGSGDTVRTLSPNEVMIGLQSHTGQVAAMLAGTIPSITQAQQSALAVSPSLRISNASLSQSSDDTTDEVSLRPWEHHSISADRFTKGSRPLGVATS